jgi:hypothetical protein
MHLERAHVVSGPTAAVRTTAHIAPCLPLHFPSHTKRRTALLDQGGNAMLILHLSTFWHCPSLYHILVHIAGLDSAGPMPG